MDPPGAKSSAETMLHEMIYSCFPDTGAVYHVHTVTATFLSMHAVDATNSLVFSGLEMLKGLGLPTHEATVRLPVFPNSQDIEALAQTIANQLNPEVPGFILQGHGLYTWGQTPFDARRHVEIWEYLFQFKLLELKAGVSSPLPVPVVRR